MLNIYGDINIPEVLTNEETIRYFEEYYNGNLKARDILIEHNIKLVIDVVVKKFNRNSFELEELVSVGNIGLINAVNTYDLNKNIKFSTYAYSCIFKILAVYIRQNIKHLNLESLNEVFYDSTKGVEITKLDILVDQKTNVENEFLKKDLRIQVLNAIEYLPERNREIVKLYYGFYNNRCYLQTELAEMYGTTHQNISLIINRSLKVITRILVKNNVVDKNDVDLKLLKR